MSNVLEKHLRFPKVADFYEGKSILLTGAGGFLGVVMLEILLRCFPNISAIYIVLRAKKGVSPEARKEVLLKKKIFDKLKKQYPDAVSKVHVISGDVSKPNFGMSEDDLQEVIQNVTIVFHCAACISFLRPLRYILENNAGSTWYAVQLCRKLKQLDAFIYTSTAYSNSNRDVEIEEEIYRLPYPAKRFVDALQNENDEELQQLMLQCQPNWPNYYTFSKCLAENILQDMASDLPVVIMRPSIIISVWKGPLPGYIEEGSGITSLSVGVGKGFIRVLYADPNVRIDIIPADIVANAHVVAAWTMANNRSPSPLIVNCTGSDSLGVTLQIYIDIMLTNTIKYPIPNSYQKPTTLKIQKGIFAYQLAAAFEHYTPAVVIDAILKLTGRKPRLVSLYRFFDSAMWATNFFLTHNWTFQRNNFNELENQLCPEDKKILHLNMNGCTLNNIAATVINGAPFYEWKNDTKSLQDRMQVASRRYWLIMAIKGTVVTCFGSILFMMTSQLLQGIHAI